MKCVSAYESPDNCWKTDGIGALCLNRQSEKQLEGLGAEARQ